MEVRSPPKRSGHPLIRLGRTASSATPQPLPHGFWEEFFPCDAVPVSPYIVEVHNNCLLPFFPTTGMVAANPSPISFVHRRTKNGLDFLLRHAWLHLLIPVPEGAAPLQVGVDEQERDASSYDERERDYHPPRRCPGWPAAG